MGANVSSGAVPIGKHARNRREGRRNGRQRFRHGSDDISHILAAYRKRAICASKLHVQNVGDRTTWRIAARRMQRARPSRYETAQSLADEASRRLQ